MVLEDITDIGFERESATERESTHQKCFVQYKNSDDPIVIINEVDRTVHSLRLGVNDGHLQTTSNLHDLVLYTCTQNFPRNR